MAKAQNKVSERLGYQLSVVARRLGRRRRLVGGSGGSLQQGSNQQPSRGLGECALAARGSGLVAPGGSGGRSGSARSPSKGPRRRVPQIRSPAVPRARVAGLFGWIVDTEIAD
jgi:hypothetical protein